MGNKQTQDKLSDQLRQDAVSNQPKKYHDDVYKALLSGLSDEEIRNAIEKGMPEVKKAYENSGVIWPGIEGFEAAELDGAHFRQAFESLVDAVDDED